LETDRVRIAIDARELCGKPTGVGRYLDRLLTVWARLPEASDHRFTLYFAGEAAPRLDHLAGLHVDCRRVPDDEAGRAGSVPRFPAGTVWEQLHLARALHRDRPDVLFAPAYTAPVAAGVPVVLTIHDLSFVAHPEWFPVRTRWRRRLVTTLAARRARHVLTVSEFSRREIVSRLGVAPERVTAVPHGLTGPAGSRPPSAGPRRGATVLFVGSIFNRRHLPELIRAVATVARRRPGVRLEIVGDNRTYPRQDLAAVAESAGISGATTIRSYVADDALADLYARAGVFVFLSDYEGFGLTPLEALSSGVPILVGDTPVAREVYGNAGVYAATADEAAVAAGIDRLLFDEAARADVLARAPAVLQRYSWERSGGETLAVLLSAGLPRHR
jgi:glycosyltransferase involved in cell wall biosynthesis